MSTTHATFNPGVYLEELRSECLSVLRMPMFVVPSLAFPMMFYLFFGVMFGGGRNAEYMLATYGAFGVIGLGLFGFGVGVSADRQQGTLQLKRVLPLPMSAYFGAKIGVCVLFSITVLVGLGIIAATIGGVELAMQQWLILFAVLVLGALPFCAIGLFIGLRCRAQAAPAVINLIYLPMAFLSGLWIPIMILPVVLQKLAVIFPAYHLAQLALSVIGRHQGQPLILHFAILALFTLISLLLAARAWAHINDR